MTKIKFCGITNLEDAKAAIELGADALGFNFFAGSSRYLSVSDAQLIVRQLPPTVWFAGVFVNVEASEVEKTARAVGLDTIQLHGDEDLEFCRSFSEWRTIKAIRLASRESGAGSSVAAAAAFLDCADYLLLDKYDPAHFGGTGDAIQGSVLSKTLAELPSDRVFLAGGLTPENVAEKVTEFRPYGVDVASGIEEGPGKKSYQLMKEFAEAVRRVDSDEKQ